MCAGWQHHSFYYRMGYKYGDLKLGERRQEGRTEGTGRKPLREILNKFITFVCLQEPMHHSTMETSGLYLNDLTSWRHIFHCFQPLLQPYKYLTFESIYQTFPKVQRKAHEKIYSEKNYVNLKFKNLLSFFPLFAKLYFSLKRKSRSFSIQIVRKFRIMYAKKTLILIY